MKKVFAACTKNNGMGIFASQDIKKGETIFIVDGKIKRAKYLPLLSFLGKRWFGIGRNIWIDPNKDNPIYFMNHSCNPNTKVKNKVEISATININKWEETTFDYSSTEADPYWKMKCKCGSFNCKKIIKGEAEWK